MSTETPEENDWRKHSARLSRRINLAWYFQTLAGPLLIVATLGALSTIILRRQFSELEILTLGLSLLGLIVLTSVICFIIAKRRFETPADSMIRLEAGLEMNSALSSAKHGTSHWPKLPEDAGKMLRYHIPKTIIPPIAALAVLALGLFIPISAKVKKPQSPSSQPQAWSQLDSQLEQLAEDEIFDEEYLEEMEERLAQLRAQEEEEWFSHASLEATDSLMDSQNSNIDQLEKDLSDAKEALEKLDKNTEELDAQQKQQLTEDFEEALERLQNGAAKPNSKLLDQLSELDPKDLGKLTPQQLSAIKKNMEKMKQSLDGMKEGKSMEESWEDQLMSGEGEGQGEGQEGSQGEGGDGSEDENGGKGGIERGPGHDPNLLKDEKELLEIGELAALNAEDLSRAIPGDLLQLQDGEHDVDKSKSKASAGGDAAKGKGGNRVWKDSLAPDEQRALKRYFE